MLDKKIDPISARFRSAETERAYQSFIQEGDWKNNLYVMSAGVTIFVFYIILDATALSQWREAAVIRLCSIFAGIAILAYGHFSDSHRAKELSPLLMTLNLSVGLNAIIYFHTSLNDAYYVGLVQECVFACFLLRMSFLKTVGAIVASLGLFSALVILKFGYADSSIQIVVLLTMTLVCSIGSYLLQKFRRFDFQKVLIIKTKMLNLMNT